MSQTYVQRLGLSIGEEADGFIAVADLPRPPGPQPEGPGLAIRSSLAVRYRRR